MFHCPAYNNSQTTSALVREPWNSDMQPFKPCPAYLVRGKVGKPVKNKLWFLIWAFRGNGDFSSWFWDTMKALRTFLLFSCSAFALGMDETTVQPSSSDGTGLATNSILLCLLNAFVKNSLICPEFKSMSPDREDTVLFCSVQQLLHPGPLKCYLTWQIILQGPSTLRGVLLPKQW